MKIQRPLHAWWVTFNVLTYLLQLSKQYLSVIKDFSHVKVNKKSVTLNTLHSKKHATGIGKTYLKFWKPRKWDSRLEIWHWQADNCHMEEALGVGSATSSENVIFWPSINHQLLIVCVAYNAGHCHNKSDFDTVSIYNLRICLRITEELSSQQW